MWLFIHRPFEVWPVLGTLRIERVYMLGVIAIWLCSGPKGLLSNRLNRAFSLFAVVLVAAWLVSPYHELGTKVVGDYFKVGIFFVLLVTTVRDERQLRTIITAFLVIMALYMLHSLREYYCGRHAWRMDTHRMIGVDATYQDPNTFAATIVYSLPMLLPFWVKDASRRTKRLVLGYLALTVTCIMLTGSRAGFLGLSFFGIVSVLFISRRRFRLLACLVIAAPLIWMALPEDRQNRYLTIIDPSRGPAGAEASAHGRLEGLKDGFRLWQQYPVLGAGPGASRWARESGRRGMQLHNAYGQLLGDMGTLGVLAFLGILGALYANHTEMRRTCLEFPELQQGFPFRVSRAVTISVLLLLFMGMAGHNLYRYTWMWFGAFQAIGLYLVRKWVARHAPVEDSLEPCSLANTSTMTPLCPADR
jgi:O-antigen ligase